MKTKLILGCLIAASAAFGGWKILANQNNAPLTDIQLANAEALASPERSGIVSADCWLLDESSAFRCIVICPNCDEVLTPLGNPAGFTNQSTIKGICPICAHFFGL